MRPKTVKRKLCGLRALNSSLANAAELIAAHSDDPATLAVAAWLAAGAPGSLWAHLGHQSDHTFSAGHTARLAERNRLLASVAPPGLGAAGRLARELRHYHDTAWKRATRTNVVCPHPEGSREAAFWMVLQLHPQPLTERQLRNILKEK